MQRLRSCGPPFGGPVVVRVKDNVYHYAGISTCGSGFAALVELLTVYHMDEPGGYWQAESEQIYEPG